jgi:ankyrin repeat protein
VVEALLDAGAGELGLALGDAAASGKTHVAALLLDRGADVHRDNDVALYYSVLSGELATVLLLLERGATARDNILATAVRVGHHAIADLLRAHGAM